MHHVLVKLAGVTLVTQLWHSRFPLGVGTRVGQQTCANHGCDHLAHKSTLCLTTNLSAPVTLAASFYVAAWVHDVLVKLAGVTLVTQLWHSPFPPTPSGVVYGAWDTSHLLRHFGNGVTSVG